MKIDQEVLGLKGGKRVFCPEHDIGDYHGPDVKSLNNLEEKDRDY